MSARLTGNNTDNEASLATPANTAHINSAYLFYTIYYACHLVVLWFFCVNHSFGVVW